LNVIENSRERTIFRNREIQSYGVEPPRSYWVRLL